MAQKKTMKIAFPNGGIIPAAELRPVKKGVEDLRVSANEPVVVSGTYGQQLVDDKFAFECSGRKVEASDPDDADAKAKEDADAKAKADADAKAKATKTE